MTMRLLVLAIVLLALPACEYFSRASQYCDQAAGAVDLICSLTPVIPVGAGGQEVTDPANPECVILSSPDKAPLEYCAE